ncbi:MAG: putative rane protein [Myxococcales bacterium]|nr:putative rane protein [Myxococcales bacterium]
MRSQLYLLTFVLTVAGCAGGTDNGTIDETTESLTKCSDKGQVVYGVDVSNYQGASINWSSVKGAGRVFGFAKASEGTGYTDVAFAHNWPGMRSAGVLRGAYHFFRPGTDGVAQADHFVNVINAQGGVQAGDLPPVADVEVSDSVAAATVIARLHAFLDRVQARTGRVPLVYTANFFWGDYLGNPNFSGYPLWVANYGPSCPYLPNAWSNWKFWQYTDKASVSGISGGVDGNMFNGTLDDLRAWAGAGGGGGGGNAGDGFQMSRRAVQNADGRVELFARAPDDAVWHDWQNTPNGSWSGWNKLGGQTTSNPVVSANEDGRLEVFVIVAGHLFHTFQLPGGGWYDGWLDEGDGNLVGEPAVMMNSNGTLEVFARNNAGALEHIWQSSANGQWGSWGSLGGVLHSDPGAARNADGRIEVFALGSDDRLYHIWQTAPHAGWSTWGAFGGPTLQGTPHVGSNTDGRLEVFATGSDDKLHHIAQVTGGWSAFLPAGSFGVVGQPAVGRNADGRLEVFARGADGALWHLWQTAANGNWTTGEAFGGTALASDPDVAPNGDGRLEVFWRAPAGNIETLFQQTGGGWSAVIDFGGNLASF